MKDLVENFGGIGDATIFAPNVKRFGDIIVFDDESNEDVTFPRDKERLL